MGQRIVAAGVLIMKKYTDYLTVAVRADLFGEGTLEKVNRLAGSINPYQYVDNSFSGERNGYYFITGCQFSFDGTWQLINRRNSAEWIAAHRAGCAQAGVEPLSDADVTVFCRELLIGAEADKALSQEHSE